MKRVILPLAFTAAVFSAFAFKPDAFAIFRSATGLDLCVPETQCTILNKPNCEVQIYGMESSPNGPCQVPVTYGRP
jgi:hypothetical protein